MACSTSFMLKSSLVTASSKWLVPVFIDSLRSVSSQMKHGRPTLNFRLILNLRATRKIRFGCKTVKGVNGYFGCDVCVTEGANINNRIAFLELDATLCTDQDFRERKYDDYHHMDSILELLPIDMIDAFPHDYLHSVLLGVTYWILNSLWDTPKLLCSRDHTAIKNRIDQFHKASPKEFQRSLRSFIECLGTMKGTEFRQYILFIGPVLLKGVIDEPARKSFSVRYVLLSNASVQ
ncbi:hypothetical protein HA402_000892 [Bradysia odoriphaga]|nr:hypothetical protein HA402_000892 [Bradysia odoriphaga]